MFKGLSAFPLTPLLNDDIDEGAFIRLLQRLAAAKVNSLGVLGSTGSYAYLSREQRKRVTAIAKAHAGDIPVMTSIGAVSTAEVLRLAEDAQSAGADALLLPVMSYQPLTDDEVYSLYEDVSAHVSVPICVYDNPRCTHFSFSGSLLSRVASLPQISAIKMPGAPTDAGTIADRVRSLRTRVPERVALGVSADAFAADGLNAGCDVWFSVCGGLFPRTAMAIAEAAARHDQQQVAVLSERLTPLWALFTQHGGGIRVMAAAAALLGLVSPECLPRPLKALSRDDVARVAAVIREAGLE
ncbi:MAG: dihydrodipicolinate synthase family protein [Pseudomonadota bacterium]